jgi:hypothetical protein
MKTAAFGFRVHSGWTALIAVAVEKGKPMVLTRQRPHLVETFSYTFRQPYHTAEKMSLDEAQEFLDGQRNVTRRLAVEALKSALSDVAQQGYKVTQAALLTASGRPLPELAKILAAHSLIHTADGEFFREAIMHGCKRQRLAVSAVKERALMRAACSKLRRSPAALTRFLTKLGKPLGAPWSQDEKFATLAAWLALSTSNQRSEGSRRR